MNAFGVQIAERTCVGSRSRNEDSIAVEHHLGHWCFVLSDGAGGHGDGARAAQLVVQRVLAGFRSRPPVDPADLSELLLDAHDAVVAGQRARAEELGAPSTMQATVVVLLINTEMGTALWGHVGDSRLYQWRGGHLKAVTRDDSISQWLLDTGLVNVAPARDMPSRGVLLAALGSTEEAVPNVAGPFELEQSDAFLLCSDGWWSGLDPQRIAELLPDAATPEDWLDRMIALTLEQADPHQDNYSAIACWISEPVEINRPSSTTERDTCSAPSRGGLGLSRG